MTPPPAPGQPCRPGLSTLCVADKRFKVQVDWFNQFDRTNGVGRAIQGSDGSGLFTFGDPSNVELMVKVEPSENGVKVSYGQLTSLFFELFVIDTQTESYKVYYPGPCGG